MASPNRSTRHDLARLAALGLVVVLGACVVHDPAVNYGYAYASGYGYADAPPAEAGSVGSPTPHEVTSQAPDPLDEHVTRSPGTGYAWIAGSWHWNGIDWVWLAGRWQRARAGYIYVPPSYNYRGPRFIYTPGHWSVHGRGSRGYPRRGLH